MINYLLYPVLELKNFIILSMICMVLLTVVLFFWMGRKKTGIKSFGMLAFFYPLTVRDLILLSMGILELIFVFAMLVWPADFGRVQISLLVLLCGGRAVGFLSLRRAVGEVLYGGMTAAGLAAGNMLLDYIRETGMDWYILAIYILLALFLILYALYHQVRGAEQIIERELER